MKIDREQINAIQQREGCTALCTLRQEKMYTYMKIKKRYMEQVVYYPVTLKGGKVFQVAFIPNSVLDSMPDFRFSTAPKSPKRGWVGRPFAFCNDCEHKLNCDISVDCPKRNEALAKRHDKCTADDRFWANGNPKKHLVLCQYSKYLYAHKISKGVCQKELCRFYDAQEGKCLLFLDKE